MPLLILTLALLGPAPLIESLPPAPTVGPAVSCVLDGYEPNNVRRRARSINDHATARLCTGDVDWLAFDAVRGERIRLTLRGAGTRAAVFAPRARKARVRLKGTQHRVFRVRRSGRHKVQIQGAVGAYTIRVERAR